VCGSGSRAIIRNSVDKDLLAGRHIDAQRWTSAFSEETLLTSDVYLKQLS